MYIYLYIFFWGGAQNNYGDHNFPPKDFDVLKNFFFLSGKHQACDKQMTFTLQKHMKNIKCFPDLQIKQ